MVPSLNVPRIDVTINTGNRILGTVFVVRLQQNKGECISEQAHSSRRGQQGAATLKKANLDIVSLVLL
jgi:hypothetical protein